MSLRTRIFAHSTVQLSAFALAFGVGYLEISRVVVPMLEARLVEKTQTVARALGSQLDVALGADDRAAIARIADITEDDADFRYLEIRDAADRVVFYRGDDVAGDVMPGVDRVAQAGAGDVRAWSPIDFEGVHLGRVAIVYSTARIDAIRAWMSWLAVAMVVIFAAAFVYAHAFARKLVAPFAAMARFARRVATGAFGEQVSISVGDARELVELAADLNAMSRDLADRERERDAAARRAAALQQELVEVSRLAGMAEVATGVLHNVGNVLNSLNVSVSVVTDRLAGSKVTALANAVALCDAHPGGLAALLSTEKGAVLPRYLTGVSRALVEENAALRAELASVARNVDHIKTIVAMQQTLARATAVVEPIDLAGLIADAIRLGELSFARHGVDVVTDYGDVPEVLADRHKLLQIVINLVSNARHALCDHACTSPRLTIRLLRRGADVVLEVADNGVGIAPDNLGKIFQHGFTTKPNGHGFGLHASAIAARELGGGIEVRSDGVGKGATFVVRLPIASRPKGVTRDLAN